MRRLLAGSAIILTACGSPGPSVPMQEGATLSTANSAIRACSPVAPGGGQSAVVGNYIFSVVWGGVLLGPLIVASSEQSIRDYGEAGAVDRCLTDSGFKRRNLTTAEVSALNGLGSTDRQRLLDHFVAGGSLSDFAT